MENEVLVPAAGDRDNRSSWITTASAAAFIFGYCAFIFGRHLTDRWIFIGNSDRLETFLNIKVFELTGIHQFGRVPTWNEHAFMGFATQGLPWMLPGFDPFMWIAALFPESHAFYVFGLISFFWYFVAAFSAYLYFREECGDAVAGTTAAVLFVSCYMAVLRIAQVDNAFIVFALIPLGMLALKHAATKPNWRNVAGFIAVVVALLGYCFLQEAAYALLLFGLYAIYLGASKQQPAFLVLTGCAVVCAVLIAFPRLYAVATEFSHDERPAEMYTTSPMEIFRWFQDGIFGRSFSEAIAVHGTHVHEGLQIFTSTFVPLLLLAWLASANFIGVWALYIVIAVVFWNAMEWPQSYLPLSMALLGGAVLALKRTKITTSYPASVAFHAAVTAFLLAAILTEPVRWLVFVAFLKQPFLHSRLSGIATLTILAMTAIALTRLGNAEVSLTGFVKRRWRIAIVCAVVVALFGLVRASIDRSELIARLLDKVVTIQEILKHHGNGVSVPAIAGAVFCAAVFVALVTLYQVWHAQPVRKQAIIFILAGFMVVDAASYVSFQLEGPQDFHYPVPFGGHNYMMVPARAFRLPDRQTLDAVRNRLETGAYRSVFITDPNTFDTHPASFLAQFWQLRLIDGYAPAVPDRLASMPWGSRELEPRALVFSSVDELNWRLLALLNVKYAIQSDLRFYYNLKDLNLSAPFDATQLRVVDNPFPVTPRAFFAHSIQPVRQAPTGTETTNLVTKNGIILPSDPTASSVVEGISGSVNFTAAGPVQLRSEGDRVRVTFAASPEQRFLVLNELYSPDWAARAGERHLHVLPTNVVMRGVFVPPNVSSVTFYYKPRFFSPRALAISLFGLLAAVGLAYVAPRWPRPLTPEAGC